MVVFPPDEGGEGFEEVLLGEYKEDKRQLLASMRELLGRRTIRNRERKITGSKAGIGMLAIHTVVDEAFQCLFNHRSMNLALLGTYA